MADLSSTISLCDRPPYFVVYNINRYGACLDGRLFAAMRLAGDAREIFDVRTGPMRDTTVGA